MNVYYVSVVGLCELSTQSLEQRYELDIVIIRILLKKNLRNIEDYGVS